MSAFKHIVDIEVTAVGYLTGEVCFCLRLEDGGYVCDCDNGDTVVNRDYYIGKELRFLPDGSYVICD